MKEVSFDPTHKNRNLTVIEQERVGQKNKKEMVKYISKNYMYLTVAETKGPCNMTMNWPENAMPRIFYFILKAIRGNDIMRLHFTINF